MRKPLLAASSLLVCSFAGTFLTGELSWSHHFLRALPILDAHRSCASLGIDPDQRVLGLPGSLFGFGYFLIQDVVVLTVLTRSERWQRGALNFGYGLSLVGLLGAISFMVYSTRILHIACLYCSLITALACIIVSCYALLESLAMVTLAKSRTKLVSIVWVDSIALIFLLVPISFRNSVSSVAIDTVGLD